MQALLLATGIGDGLGIRTPSQLLDATEWSHRALERLILQDILAGVDGAILSNISHERMKDTLYVVIPVAIVHVGNETTCSQRKIRRILLDGSVIRQLLDEDYLLAIWREAESLDAQFVVGELLSASTVWIHAPELSATDEGNLLSALNPGGISLALGISGQCLLVLPLASMMKSIWWPLFSFTL